MKPEINLHDAMDAVAATTPPLDASDVLARGKRQRTRRQVLLTACTTATVILGLGTALAVLSPGSPPPRQAAPPTADATPSYPTTSPTAIPTPASLEPADRFTKRREKPFNGAFASDIIDTSLPSDQRDASLLRLIRDPHTTTLTEHVDDVTPERLRISGIQVRLYLTGSDEDVQQAEWVRDRTLYVLQWKPRAAPYQISESDIRWMITESIAGRF
ncbi:MULTISPECIES: hypothetical protein [unclassified Micromonospora]|uniref:hypothetical protein n=1 Tax=unclassified Micromonospora TaxID=2617518 RepID=UPI002FF09001